MIQHPTIAAALVEQRRTTLMAEAESARLARAVRDGAGSSSKSPVRWFRPRRRPGTPAAQRGLARLRPARAR